MMLAICCTNIRNTIGIFCNYDYLIFTFNNMVNISI